MCSSDFKPNQTRFAATAPLFTWAGLECWRIRSLSMWQYFTHSTTGWTLFTALMAGFVNFSNRISSLLFVTLALTSSSRIDKYAPWMLSWQSESLTDRNEWVTRFLVRSPSTFALTNAGNGCIGQKNTHIAWWQRQLSWLLLPMSTWYLQTRGQISLNRQCAFQGMTLGWPDSHHVSFHKDALFSGICYWIVPGCILSRPMREALWGRLSSCASCHLMEKKSTRTVQRSSSSPRHKAKYAQ